MAGVKLTLVLWVAFSNNLAFGDEGHFINWQHDPQDNTNYPTREICWERCFQVKLVAFFKKLKFTLQSTFFGFVG